LKVVFNADDYGLHRQVSLGILQAMEAGVVRSTTVMANLVSREELEWLRACPGVSVGLHFNLTRGAPFSGFPRKLLTPDGCFSRELFFRPEGGPVLELEAVRTELEAQLHVLDGAGIEVTHLDSHHHIHGWAVVLAAAVELARERRLAVRPLSSWMVSYLSSSGIRCPDLLLTGFFGENNAGVEHLQQLLREAQASGAQTVEIMCHPGRTEGLSESNSSYIAGRAEELSTLCSHKLPEWLDRAGIRVVGYGQV